MHERIGQRTSASGADKDGVSKEDREAGEKVAASERTENYRGTSQKWRQKVAKDKKNRDGGVLIRSSKGRN